jgi:hypothetical protein
MPGLVPGIHVLNAAKKTVDGRDKPGHDEPTHTIGVICCGSSSSHAVPPFS